MELDKYLTEAEEDLESMSSYKRKFIDAYIDKVDDVEDFGFAELVTDKLGLDPYNEEEDDIIDELNDYFLQVTQKVIQVLRQERTRIR